jgi:sodium/proline symporter
MIEDSTVINYTFAGYIAVMLAIGLAGYCRTSNLSDYLLGGRQLGRWVTALSAEASDMSGWLLLGLPGYAYASGFEAGWIALGLLVGTWLNWTYVAERLRRYTQVTDDAVTLPEFLERRFEDGSRLLRVVAAIFILLFFTFYTSSGLVASGKLFGTVFGMEYQTAILAGAAVVVAYTFLGGFLAVSWTDLIQGWLMIFALLAVPIAVMEAQAGWQPSLQALHKTNPALLDPLTNAAGDPLTVLAIASLLGWGLGYFTTRIRYRKSLHAYGQCALPATDRRCLSRRNTRRDHEYGGFTVAGGLVRIVGRFLQAVFATECQPPRTGVDGAACGHHPRGDRDLSCAGT